MPITLPPATPPPALTELSVTVENIRSNQGRVCAALFNGPQGFPNDTSKVARRFCVSIHDPTALKMEIDSLPAGTYALALFHDENGDGKLNTGLFGIPKESFGFSNNPTVRMGSPSYQETTFTTSGKETSLKVSLRKL